MPVNGVTRWILLSLAVLGFLITAVTAIAIARLAFQHTASLVAYDPTPGPHLVIGFDISQGSPLIADRAFARRAGERLRGLIEPLPNRSLVTVRAFGDYGVTPGPLSFDRVISLRQTGETVGVLVGAIAENMPDVIESGRVLMHAESNIVAFLEAMSQSIDCQRETRILLVTDGLEDSEFGDLLEPDTQLPAPTDTIFPGCTELQLIGLGHGQTSPLLARRISGEWKAWANQAGFETFRGLSTW